MTEQPPSAFASRSMSSIRSKSRPRSARLSLIFLLNRLMSLRFSLSVSNDLSASSLAFRMSSFRIFFWVDNFPPKARLHSF